MNIELLERVKERILAEPEHFHMANWAIEVDEHNLGEPWCRTTFCIGGWAAVLTGKVKTRDEMFEMIAEQYGNGSDLFVEILGTPNSALFFASRWPYKFQRRYNDLRGGKDHIGLANLAGEVIDDYIETNGWVT
jgi:hypothetical protein